MRRLSCLTRFLSFLLLAVAFVAISPAFAQFPGQQNPREAGPDTRETRQFYVRGWVSDAVTHRRIENVRVELRATTGPIVGTDFTRGNGDFEFPNVPEGSYSLTAVANDYLTTTQEVQVVFGPVMGLDVEMRPEPDAKHEAQTGASKISVRELSIPHKAQEDMKSGLNLLYQKSDYKGSIKQFEKAIKEYPDYYEAYAAMGIAYIGLKDNETAEQTLRKSVEVSHEQYVDGYCMLADLLSNNKRFSDAEPIARKGVDLDAESWKANSELARALLGLNRPADAEPNALKAAKLVPQNPQMHLLLADVHMGEQNYPALLEDLNEYLKLDPNGPAAEQARKQRDQVQQYLASSQPSESGEPKTQQ